MNFVTDVEICKMALGQFGDKEILSVFPSDGTKQSEKCMMFYHPKRRELLEAYEWKFAQKTLELADENIKTIAIDTISLLTVGTGRTFQIDAATSSANAKKPWFSDVGQLIEELTSGSGVGEITAVTFPKNIGITLSSAAVGRSVTFTLGSSSTVWMNTAPPYDIGKVIEELNSGSGKAIITNVTFPGSYPGQIVITADIVRAFSSTTISALNWQIRDHFPCRIIMTVDITTAFTGTAGALSASNWQIASNTPAKDFTYQLSLPNDCLRPFKVEDEDDNPWEQEGDKILTDGSSAVLTYCADITDETKFSAKFVECFVLKMAIALIVDLSEDKEQAQITKNDINNTLQWALGKEQKRESRKDRTLGNFTWASAGH